MSAVQAHPDVTADGVRIVSDAPSAGAVRVLAWHRPEKRNAINLAMYRAMTAALRDADADATVKVIVVSGCGEAGAVAFTAGNDLADFAAVTGSDAGLDASRASDAGNACDRERAAGAASLAPVLAFLDTLNGLRKPLLASVRGPAVGIGTTMLLHCDIACAGDDARFAMPFTALGLCPEAGASLLLPRMAGYQRAARLLLLGERFDAQQALSYGLVTEVLPGGEVDAHVLGLARKLAALPATAVQATKALLKPRDGNAETGVSATAAQIAREAAVFAELLGTAEAQQRIRAAVHAGGGKLAPGTAV